MKQLIIRVALLGLLLVPLSAQSNKVEVTILKTMAGSTDPSHKMAALEIAEKLLLQGTLTRPEEQALLDVVGDLACEGVVHVVYDSFSVGNDHSQVRLEANRLLGLAGDPYALDTLLRILQQETQTHILAEAMTACGEIGVRDKKLDSVIYMILTGKKSCYRNERLIYRTMETISKIRDNDESIMLSDKVREGLFYISDDTNGFNRDTRQYAAGILRL